MHGAQSASEVWTCMSARPQIEASPIGAPVPESKPPPWGGVELPLPVTGSQPASQSPRSGGRDVELEHMQKTQSNAESAPTETP